MPFGAPAYTVPKSACAVRVAPMVATYAADAGSSGSASTRVFQMLSAGSMGQPASVGAARGAGTAKNSSTAATSSAARGSGTGEQARSVPGGVGEEPQLRGPGEERGHRDAEPLRIV